MTHINNVAHIQQYGITHRLSPNHNPAYVPIGDPSIIDTRSHRQLANGQTLGAFIPFYFGPRMPMLYVIQRGYNNVSPTPASDVVYCVSSVALMLQHQVPFLFTDGHAIDGLTGFYGQDQIDQLESLLDFKAIQSKYWKDEKDLDLKRRMEAELLAAADIPVTAILGYVVNSDSCKEKLLQMGIDEKQIGVRSNYYF